MPDLQVVEAMYSQLRSTTAIYAYAYLLHIVPVGDDTVLDGVLEGKDTTLGLSLVSYIGVFLTEMGARSSVLQLAALCIVN